MSKICDFFQNWIKIQEIGNIMLQLPDMNLHMKSKNDKHLKSLEMTTMYGKVISKNFQKTWKN